MNSLMDRDRALNDMDMDREDPPDREFTLSIAMLLGIFFGLALVCAACFGFGYSMGSKSGSARPEIAKAEPSSVTLNGAAKPAPGRSSLAAASAPTGSNDAETPRSPKVTVPDAPSDSPKFVPPDQHLSETREPARMPPAPSQPVSAPPVAATPAPSQAATAILNAANPTAGVAYMVQIAAVTHQEDADMLVSALKGRGYTVAVHTSPQDKFMHVQIGPFTNKKDAESMRQKLLADGFNAILK